MTRHATDKAREYMQLIVPVSSTVTSSITLIDGVLSSPAAQAGSSTVSDHVALPNISTAIPSVMIEEIERTS